MTNVRHTLIGVVGMLVVVLSACGTSTSTNSSALPPLTGEDQALVQFEAQWLCDVQRHGYAELAQMDTARSELMSAFGVTPSGYENFKGRLEADQNLREHVSAAYGSVCG